MSDIRVTLPDSDTIALSGRAVDALVRSGDGDGALVYLYALRCGGALSLKTAAKALGRSEADVSAAMARLGRLGLLQCGDLPPAPPQKDELPEYTADDIRRELSNGSVFGSLVTEVQRSLGKILSSDDLIKLFGIYDGLGLPPEVILQLVTHCIGETRRRYGPGRTPTMRYIEKAAYTWEREGLFTLDLAEGYIRAAEERRGRMAEVRKVLQIRDREFTASERRYVEGWLALGFSPEVIELAYDRTVLKTGRLAWSYMDSIISSWHAKGLRTTGDIAAKDGRGPRTPKKPAGPKRTAGAPDPADIERMKKLLNQMKGE